MCELSKDNCGGQYYQRCGGGTAKNGGSEFMAFSIAVNENKNTTFFSVTVFADYLLKIAEYLNKGREVLVEGRISVNENKYFNIIANNIQLGAQPKDRKRGKGESKTK